ncbi:transglutaminase-like domain-containing protein [Chitinolyticbacter albus]|uniref:transglutaminase-like domain-containing protein n=1 Tax=Chitinolyticbacter albus TaxID=2961951 RepID=UPI00210DD56B|nr:transglutaminase-like domain-containing protein [Chitinolyticbacter albus]
MTNSSELALNDATAWFYVPMRVAAGQRRTALDIHGMGFQLIDAGRGQSLVKIVLPELPAFSSKIIRVQATLSPYWNDTLLEPTLYLHGSRFIEVDDPTVQSLANMLRQDSPLLTARAIYDWVSGNLSYAGFTADDFGAAYALRHRRGDCTEYAYLYTALARGCQIPARVMGGYVLNRDGLIRSAEYHNWSEVWIDEGWQVVDAQKQMFLPQSLEYIAYRELQSGVADGIDSVSKFWASGGVKLTME